MENIPNVSVVIPSLNPDEKLEQVVRGLEEAGLTDIIIVNDGSSEENLKFFPDTSVHPGCVILTHEANRGKGAALKTAFKYFLDNKKSKSGVVTVDGDAQHRPLDVLACAREMEKSERVILGARDFSLPHVPKRSRKGNRITSAVFRVLCGMKISDTQTGLRAFPTKYVGDMLSVAGTRFEYETNMLLYFKTAKIPYGEVKIETVYIEENKTSHFRPVRDSLRVYGFIVKYIFSSLFSFAVDEILFILILSLLGEKIGADAKIVATVVARIFSSVCNFFINKKSVFKNNGKVAPTLLKYYTVAIPVMLISAYAVKYLTMALGIANVFLCGLIKIVVDSILFIMSFRLQREWVFNSDKRRKDK